MQDNAPLLYEQTIPIVEAERQHFEQPNLPFGATQLLQVHVDYQCHDVNPAWSLNDLLLYLRCLLFGNTPYYKQKGYTFETLAGVALQGTVHTPFAQFNQQAIVCEPSNDIKHWIRLPCPAVQVLVTNRQPSEYIPCIVRMCGDATRYETYMAYLIAKIYNMEGPLRLRFYWPNGKACGNQVHVTILDN